MSLSLCGRCARKASYQTRQYSSGRDYNAAVAALNGLQSNFSIVEAIRKQGTGANKNALPMMTDYVRRIGYETSDFDRLNPIHIAGTKGKGSTASFVSSILAQYLPTERSVNAERLPSAVGLYTSPHLRSVRERIKVNNVPISEEVFAECFWEIWDKLEATQPPADQADPWGRGGKPIYFHYLTLMALHCYSKQKIGTAVIECGIGGEFDTTNILVHPSVTAVTSLGIDHEALLGSTIAEIAWHKAGIFKPTVPAFTIAQPDEALKVLRARAEERSTELYVVPEHQTVGKINLGLQGHFQKLNASLAIAACIAHLDRLGYSGLPELDNPNSRLPEEFVRGLESTRLGGRCDFRRDPRLSGVSWYIDGGHTLESIDVAGRWYASRSAEESQSKPESENATRILIFNQQTRDAPNLARHLHETLATALKTKQPFTHVIFCPNTTYKDAGYKADLVSMNTNKDDITSLRVQHELARAWDTIDKQAQVHVLSTIEEAIERARDLSHGGKADVLVTGSLHLIGGLIEVLENEAEILAKANTIKNTK